MPSGSTTAFNGGDYFFFFFFFFFWPGKKESVAVLLFSTFGKVSNMPDLKYKALL